MAQVTSGDKNSQVASGFPDPDKVPGPTQRLRELHGDKDAEMLDPKYGRATVATAGTDDHVGVDQMANGGQALEASMSALADRVAAQTASMVRQEMAARDIPQRARRAGWAWASWARPGSWASAPSVAWSHSSSPPCRG